MTEWALNRFWTSVDIKDHVHGFCVTLDGRPVKTPGKHDLVLPTRRFAHAVAAEWQAQDGQVRPDTMPFTRAANTAIERVAPQRDEVIAMLAEYADTDLICYLAQAPIELITKQTEIWEPIRQWASQELGLNLQPRSGVMPVSQAPEVVPKTNQILQTFSSNQLVGIHDLIAISGSAVIGLAVVYDHLSIDAAWRAARVDEDWQMSQWGVDEDAESQAAFKRQEFVQAEKTFRLSCQ